MVLGIAVYIMAGELQTVRLGIGPAGFPRFIAVLLVVLGVVQTAMTFKAGVNAPTFNVEKRAACLFISAIVMCVVYVMLVSTVGFVLLTPLLMIGMMFEPAGDKAFLRETARELVIRYGVAVVFALALYHLTPFDPIVRRTLAVICFGPLSSLAPIYTDRCGADSALASFTNSASIAVSLVCMLALSFAFVL